MIRMKMVFRRKPLHAATGAFWNDLHQLSQWIGKALPWRKDSKSTPLCRLRLSRDSAIEDQNFKLWNHFPAYVLIHMHISYN